MLLELVFLWHVQNKQNLSSAGNTVFEEKIAVSLCEKPCVVHVSETAFFLLKTKRKFEKTPFWFCESFWRIHPRERCTSSSALILESRSHQIMVKDPEKAPLLLVLTSRQKGAPYTKQGCRFDSGLGSGTGNAPISLVHI